MKLSRRAAWLAVAIACVAVGLTIWGLDRFYREEENYTEIEPGLYLGDFVLAPPRGVKAVINLGELEDPYQAEVHIWERIPDRAPAPPLDWLRRMVERLHRERKAETATFVHCSSGKSRSAMLVAAYLMYKHGWTREQALQYIHSKRPQTRLNAAFVELLGDWERDLARPGTK
jgi:protein-tyrosine phosphatase